MRSNSQLARITVNLKCGRRISCVDCLRRHLSDQILVPSLAMDEHGQTELGVHVVEVVH